MRRTIAIVGLMMLAASAFAGGLTPTTSQTRVYGTVTMFGDSVANARVTLTLTGSSYFYVTGGLVAAGKNVTYTDASGRFSFDPIWGTDSLSPGGDAVYTLTIEQPEIAAGGIKMETSGLVIPADGDSTDIRDVLAGNQ